MPKISGSYHGITAQPQFQTYPTAGMLQIPQQPQTPQAPPTPTPPPTTTTPTAPPILPPVTPLGPVLPGSDTVTPERERLIRSMLSTFER